jgi:hypothetical protein
MLTDYPNNLNSYIKILVKGGGGLKAVLSNTKQKHKSGREDI